MVWSFRDMLTSMVVGEQGSFAIDLEQHTNGPLFSKTISAGLNDNGSYIYTVIRNHQGSAWRLRGRIYPEMGGRGESTK